MNIFLEKVFSAPLMLWSVLIKKNCKTKILWQSSLDKNSLAHHTWIKIIIQWHTIRGHMFL